MMLARISNSRRTITPGWRMLLALIAFVVFSSTVGATEKAAAKVSLNEIDGRKFGEILARHRGQIVLVDFWATWCAPCKKLFSKTVELHEKYQDQGLAVISVSFDDAEERQAALEFLTEKHAGFENYISKNGFDSGDVFEIVGGALPYYRIYDRNGKLYRTFASGDPDHVFKEQDIETAIQSLVDRDKK